jgi:NADPH:quinone reductase-like Zn-dependent oxidoreductase
MPCDEAQLFVDGGSRMQAYRIYSGRREKALERIERSTPPLGPNDVRISVGAVSLNYRDLMIARGAYPVSSEDP